MAAEERIRRHGFFKGHLVEETDERVNVIGRRFFRARARALAEAHRPEVPSYHLRVESVPNVPFLYEVAAYQNILTKAPLPEREHS